MPTNEEIKSYLDTLTPKERQVAKDYLSSLEGTKGELATNLSSESIETQTDTFCGIAVDQFTAAQKKLFDKLSSQQKEELTQKVSINKTKGQIEFTQIKKAIKDTDIASNVTKSGADDAVNKLGNEWSLPKDVDFTDNNRLALDPAQSDYDAMILQMPGANNNEKVENFRLLTGMLGRYRTSQNYNKSSSEFVLREFFKDARNRLRYYGSGNGHVRPVRSL